jgi:uncharacterized protein YcfL
MRKTVVVPLAVLAFLLVGCGSAAPTSTPADVIVCHQFNSVMGSQPATHTWTWLESVFQSDPPSDTTLSNDMTTWLNLMAAGGWAPGSGEQNQTAQAAVSIQQYCNSIHAG